MAGQPTLPFEPTAPDLDLEIRASLSGTIHRSRLSIEQLADRLALALNRPVSAGLLRCMCAPSQAHRFPAAWVNAWCQVTGDSTLLRILIERAGLPMPVPTDTNLLGFARAQIHAQLAQQEADLYKVRALRGGAV